MRGRRTRFRVGWKKLGGGRSLVIDTVPLSTEMRSLYLLGRIFPPHKSPLVLNCWLDTRALYFTYCLGDWRKRNEYRCKPTLYAPWSGIFQDRQGRSWQSSRTRHRIRKGLCESSCLNRFSKNVLPHPGSPYYEVRWIVKFPRLVVYTVRVDRGEAPPLLFIARLPGMAIFEGLLSCWTFFGNNLFDLRKY